MSAAGRAGFVARGVVYVLIGVLAIRIAVGSGGGQADREGALAEVSGRPFGAAVLWALAVGFGCMALWRGIRAIRARGGDRKVASRLMDGGRAVFYATVCWGTVTFAAGTDRGSNGNAKSRDWTRTALQLPYGQPLVGAAGCVLAGIGVVLAVRAAMRRFLRRLDLAATPTGTRQVVTALGVGGGVARGMVATAAGIFVLVAAIRFDPQQAKGVDATLRSLAGTPAGPWLLVAVAIGLMLFGAFSFASARWRRM
ncbi:DUF1206 domain-containing protein [Streptomyces sp. ASQP_92]|uniref:DUF1206 domain-containing protein n=1 Tax=Streptomyces sp. ASQP_92 TaxID=2979116 RepID=UPI0021BED11B|nr:DUF1206 domain-containing protein [Streptomyces sp. ASQP_92]MCT9092457.1 DUF1206 domain-containing protein [Streptomyces sp. ASQP_92]